MARAMTIDIVSDIVCPWCVIGIRGLERALEALDGEVDAELRLHPFELNPQMPPEGQNIVEHVAEKYGSTPEQSDAARARLHALSEALGFAMNTGRDSRITNSFDAHRLLHWAQEQGRAVALKHALFEAYFTRGASSADHDALVRAATDAGLDAEEARAVLKEGRFGDEVRTEQAHWRAQGINAVPAFVIDGQYLIQGGQPPEAFEQALRKIAQEPAAAE